MPRHPFQKLCPISSSDLLVAAAGSKLYGIDTSSGQITWKFPPAIATSADDEQRTNYQEPHAKRRKLENGTTATKELDSPSRRSSEDSINIKTERVKGERKKTKVEKEPPPPNVSHVLATEDGGHLVIVTAEDKAVSVYEVTSTGLVFKSKRHMPKRLCAATLTPDERFLVVGDKFGDVYELPLHPTEGWVAPQKKEDRDFEPSATELTVHTKGNLQALKQQKEQKMKAKEKEGLSFEHRVLLGHVSLLTDVEVAHRAAEDGKQRKYVLTADRDEHVRVSRYPQAHIIEGYCLGIQEFVSRLCVVPWASQWVAVGTGEPSLRIYEWLNGQLLSIDTFQELGDKLRRVICTSGDGRDHQKLAVSGIWPVRSVVDRSEDGQLLVALEGVPLLLSYTINSEGKLSLRQTMELSGNVLDVAVLPSQQSLVVSLDAAHVSGSTLSYDTHSAASTPSLVAFELEVSSDNASWKPSKLSDTLTSAVAQINDVPDVPDVSSSGRQGRKGAYSPLGEFLYGLENLRKKRGMDAQEAEEDEGEEVLPEGEVPPEVK